MSKAPIIHTETFTGDKVTITYFGYTFEVEARMFGDQLAIRGLTEGLKRAKKEAKK